MSRSQTSLRELGDMFVESNTEGGQQLLNSNEALTEWINFATSNGYADKLQKVSDEWNRIKRYFR